MSTDTVSDLEGRLTEARAAQYQAERLAAVEAASARLGIWQDWLTCYDRRALRDAVHATWARLVDTLRGGGDIGTALVEHVRAIVREGRADGLASDAVAAGATLPAGVEVGPGQFRDASGGVVTEQLGTLVPMLLSLAVVEIADRDTADEAAAVRAQAERAYSDALLGTPSGYRVTASRPGDWSDVIGGAGTVRFADSTAYLMVAELGPERLASIIRYMRSVDGYVIDEIYGPAPAHHAEALRRLPEPE